MKSRYCYNTCVFRKVGRRTTLLQQFRRWRYLRKQEKAIDIYPVVGYSRPTWAK